MKSYIITLLQNKFFAHKKVKKVEKIGIITPKCSEWTTSLVTFGLDLCTYLLVILNTLNSMSIYLSRSSWGRPADGENCCSISFTDLKGYHGTLGNLSHNFHFMWMLLHWRESSFFDTDFNTDECIEEFIKRKWTSGPCWAGGAAAKKNAQLP